jgi:mevalonate kinase
LGNECKYDALEIENIINKNHSGVDFAAIWEERPIVITNGRYEFVDLPNQLRHCFLVDTGIPSEPTSIILQGIKERYLHEKVLQDSLEAIGNCTERLLSGENPLTVFPDHNRSQVRLGVVPPSVRSLIERIERSGGAAKATRSGGNSGGVGMVVAVHPDLNRLKRIVGKSLISYATASLVCRQRPEGPIRRASQQYILRYELLN